ncbi:MAG: ribbon-helix-helix protein, CopG family [Burkholderiales bacterium]|nr:ribbon-helix-helix protein, CopG family [Burkholderiales bacterium]
MAAATERIPVLVTPDQKAKISKKAKAANLTVGEFVRRAAEAYQPDDDDDVLERLIEQIKNTAAKASKALDAILAFVAESEKRIEQMEAAHPRKRAI